MTSRVSRISEQDKPEQKRVETAKPIVAYIIETHPPIIPKRLQKLAFYADAIHYNEHGTRLLSVNWGTYMYGMFSYDIRAVLEDFEENGGDTKNTLEHGFRTVCHFSPPNGFTVNNHTASFLDEIIAETQDMPLEPLATWTKKHPLFESTDYDDVVNFTSIDWE